MKEQLADIRDAWLLLIMIVWWVVTLEFQRWEIRRQYAGLTRQLEQSQLRLQQLKRGVGTVAVRYRVG